MSNSNNCVCAYCLTGSGADDGSVEDHLVGEDQKSVINIVAKAIEESSFPGHKVSISHTHQDPVSKKLPRTEYID